MMESNGNYALNEASVGMVEALTSCTNKISWAADMINIYKSMESFYLVYNNIEIAPPSVKNLGAAVKKLERYLRMDVARHIATQNGRNPYYIGCMQDRLRDSLSALRAYRLVENPEDIHLQDKQYDHLTADLQATFLEYGFCTCIEILYEVEEIMRKLERVDYRVKFIEDILATNNANYEALIITDLRDVIAQQHGIQHAITETDFQRVSRFYNNLTNRIAKLENGIKIDKDSTLFRGYIQSQINLKQDIFSLCQTNATDIISNHMIHPGTRNWLLDYVHHWYVKSTQRVFYFGGWKGCGMTAMASTICKLYGSDVIGCHFFNATDGDSKRNHITGLLESLAFDMCKTLPRYSKYIHDNYGSQLKSHLNGSWKNNYDILFKNPLKSIYGHGKRGPVRRKLLIIDGLNECVQSEWNDVKEFLSRFAADFTARFCIFVTAELHTVRKLVDVDRPENINGIRLEDKPWLYNHIRDLEIYVASSVGAILSGEDEADLPFRARADAKTLQETVDAFVRLSAGRFDFAMELMATFAKEMLKSGQFLSSIKKSTATMHNVHGQLLDDLSTGFSRFHSAYRVSEGSTVLVRVLRQSAFPLDKTRVALIRAHQTMA